MFACPKKCGCSQPDNDIVILENTLPPVKQTEKPPAFSDTPSSQALPDSFFNVEERMNKQEIEKRTKKEVRRRARESVVKRDQATVVSEHFIKTVKMQKKNAGASTSKKATPVIQDTTGTPVYRANIPISIPKKQQKENIPKAENVSEESKSTKTVQLGLSPVTTTSSADTEGRVLLAPQLNRKREQSFLMTVPDHKERESEDYKGKNIYTSIVKVTN